MKKEKKSFGEKKDENIKKAGSDDIVRQDNRVRPSNIARQEDVARQLEECQKQKQGYLNGWKRERADFLNYKKEEMERINGLIKYATEELILKILPVLDNFEMAIKEIQNPLDAKRTPQRVASKIQNSDEIIKGFLQIKSQILDFLKGQGVEEIQCLGQKFDPNFMEAIKEVEVKDRESGIIIEEIKKGYFFHGKVIRPAKVKVAK